MTLPIHERRQIENEMIFRRANEMIGDGLDDIDEMHKSDGNLHLIRNHKTLLHFKCECSDENCDERITIKLSTYQKIHENRDTYVIKLKHQVEAIEEVVLTEKTYSVVKKNNSTPEPGKDLNETTIDNS
ncbi:MAG TPA: hypothetical protein VNI82_00475 [Candidatus Nitrosotenuis sp.]|nr:hypothetical protein [Candidatus Nitrosotenuis sp.]